MTVSWSGDLAPSDLLALHELVARYGHVMDAKAWHRFGEVFAADAVLDLSAYGMWIATGVEEIIARFPLLDHPQGHHTTNLVIEPPAPSGVGAPGTVHMRSKYIAVRPMGPISVGEYRDEAALREGEWRLIRRALLPRRR
jgi:hypothetical protein